MFLEELNGTVTFSDEEYSAIATLILKLFCVDHNMMHLELVSRKKIYDRIGVTSAHEQSRMSVDDAMDLFRKMDAQKRNIVKKTLCESALTDGIFCKSEMDFIENLCGSVSD